MLTPIAATAAKENLYSTWRRFSEDVVVAHASFSELDCCALVAAAELASDYGHAFPRLPLERHHATLLAALRRLLLFPREHRAPSLLTSEQNSAC
jgi:hypothetical protein